MDLTGILMAVTLTPLTLFVMGLCRAYRHLPDHGSDLPIFERAWEGHKAADNIIRGRKSAARQRRQFAQYERRTREEWAVRQPDEYSWRLWVSSLPPEQREQAAYERRLEAERRVKDQRTKRSLLAIVVFIFLSR